MANEIIFEIKERIGVLASFNNGWNKEINRVSWNGNPAKYDIRDWSPEHDKMSRGITLSPVEMNALIRAMEGRL